MKLFDAHCHSAPVGDVAGAAVCGTSPDDWNSVFQTLGKSSGVYPLFGIHPWFVGCRAGAVTPPETAITDRGYNWREEFQTLEKLLRDFPSIGIGECGLDFSDKFQNRAEQEECFAAQLELARELNRPVAIHCVQAWGRMLDIVRDYPEPKKILHAYSGSAELVPELVQLNCRFSFGEAVGNSKYKRARKAVAAVPTDRLLIETDSAGEPEKLIAAARAVAELRGVSVEEIAELTFANAQAVFYAAPGCAR